MGRVQRQDWAEAEGRVSWFDNFLEAPRCEGILAELDTDEVSVSSATALAVTSTVSLTSPGFSETSTRYC